MAKKFNGHRCERRNLTDLVLGTGPTGKKRAKPKAKNRPKNYTTEPAVNRMNLGGNPPSINVRDPRASVLPMYESPETLPSSTTQVAMPGMPGMALNQNMIPDVVYRNPSAQATEMTADMRREAFAKQMAEARKRYDSGEEHWVEDVLEIFPGFNTVLGANDAYRAGLHLYENGIKDNPQLYDDVLDILGVVPVGGAFAGVAKGARKAAKLKAASKLAGKAPTSLKDVRDAGILTGMALRTPGAVADQTQDERGIKRYGGAPHMNLGSPTVPTPYTDDPATNAQMALAARAAQLMNQFTNPLGGMYDERHPAVMGFIDDTLLGGRFGDKQDDFRYKYLPAGMEDIKSNYAFLGKNLPVSQVPEGATNITQEYIGAPWSAATVSHLASAYDPSFEGSARHSDYINRAFAGEGNYEPGKLKNNTEYAIGDVMFGGRRGQESHGKNYNWFKRQARKGSGYGSHSDIIYDITTDADGNQLYKVMGGNMSDTLYDRTFTADQLRKKYQGRLHNSAPYTASMQQQEADAYTFAPPGMDMSRQDQLSIEDLNAMGEQMNLSPYQRSNSQGFLSRIPGMFKRLFQGATGLGGAAAGVRKMYLGQPTGEDEVDVSGVDPEVQQQILANQAAQKLQQLQGERAKFDNRIVDKSYTVPPNEIVADQTVTAPMIYGQSGGGMIDPQLLSAGAGLLSNALADDNSIGAGALRGVSTALPLASALGPLGMLGAAGFGAIDAAFKQKQEAQRPMTQMYEQKLARREAEPDRIDQFNEQAYANYAQFGNVNPLLYARYGGPMEAPDYETEGGEMIMASPDDPPIAMGQGEYKKESANMYRIDGPSHEFGGVPTKGAMEPFVDEYGQQHDSPYVFSDAPEMEMDATEILKLLR